MKDPTRESGPMSQRPKILIVDDVPENVEILGEILADTHDILCAFSGEEALALAVEEPDLILLDVMMPGMDGYEVCARLKADAATATIPVIFVTAKTSPEDETAGFAAGAVDFVTKPVNRDTVQARIRTHLRLKHQSDRLRAQAMIDDVTGIPNRRYFETRLLDAWRHAQRHQAPLALLLLELDHFASYQDLHGPEASASCLRRIAATLKAGMLRAHDLAARQGGEAFVCLLPECDLAGATAKAEALRAAVADLAIPHGASPTAAVLTVSLGVAAALPTAETRPASLVAAADALLSQARQAGGNQVRSADRLL